MKISVIIPTLDEAANISRLLRHLCQNQDDRLAELIVVDGGSTDATRRLAREAGALVVRAERPGRARQMNRGAACATGEILYFVHADSRPPATYLEDIHQSFQQGYPGGCYRFRFDSDHPFLRINAFFTRFDRLWCRGGDQTLFIKRTLFEELGGFPEEWIIMEEFDLIRRMKANHPFRIIPKEVVVSSRKYEDNGYMKVQFANLVVFNMYRLGCSQEAMAGTYRRLIRYRS